MFSYKIYLLLIMMVITQIPRSFGILHDLFEIIDLSNVDLRNYQYFKNFPSQDPRYAGKANLFLEHFQKKKAVIDYFENLFLGNSPFTYESEIVFDPHFGRAWRPYYQRKFGKRGEHLIAMLGYGYNLENLRRHGAIPKEFGSRNYPS